MAKHSGRCVRITCNFTHPSAQTGNRIYPPQSYTYSYEQDDVGRRRDIERHAKRQYAQDNRLKPGWIGFIRTSDRILNSARADTEL